MLGGDWGGEVDGGGACLSGISDAHAQALSL